MRRALFLVAGVGLAATLLAPATALAQRRSDWYYEVRPYLGRRSQPTVREARLWDETVQLRSAIRRADRRGDLTSKEAEHFYDRLDRVARFLRDDRQLSDSEFNRRRDDLNDIGRDLHRDAREHRTRDDRSNDRRYDDRYGRRTSSNGYDDRYGQRTSSNGYVRRAADVCDLCGGACRYR